ncbi:MAG: transglutaminase-like domain-containing protein [Vulcanimicrobiota bacterium]
MKAIDWAGGVCILIPFLALCVLSQNPVNFLMAALAFILIFFRGRLEISRTGWLVWSLLGVVGFMLLFRNTSLATTSGLVYANFYPLALSMGWANLMALLRRHTRGQYWMALSMSGLFFLLTGLNMGPELVIFAILATLWMVLFCMSSREFLTNTRLNLSAWLVMVPTLAVTGLTSAAFTYSEAQFGFLMRLMSMGGDAGLTFPAQNNLNTMLNSETNPAVVVRCFTRQPNSYLPARVYTTFRDKVWTEFAPSGPAQATPAAEGYRYALAEPQPEAGKGLKLERFEVHASPIVFFCPRDAVWVESKEPALALLSGHLLEQRGGGNDLQAYTVARLPNQELAPAESPEYLKACLQLPENLDPIIVKTAREVMAGVDDRRRKALQCQLWFQSNFQYGFGYDWAGAKDPIAEFLTKKPAAHCEIFAASMTLMLRSQGIPARYVNGFVCVERAYGGDYYVVRVRDAHAWVEMWDGSHWRTYDPTPPSAIQPPKDWGAWFDRMREGFNYYTRDLANLDWRALLASAWERKSYFAGLLVLYFLWRARKTRWFPSLSSAPPKTPESEWIRSLSRALAVREQSRRECETLLHWAERLEDGEISQWLKDYSAYRYGGAAEQDLGERHARLIKRLQSPPS